VAVTAYVAFEIDQTISSDWSYMADSFLMSPVALGGAINLSPLIFNRVPQNRGDVKKFRYAVAIGLFV